MTQGLTTDMPTKNIQEASTPRTAITLGVTTTLETEIVLQVDTHLETGQAPMAASTPETEINLQDDISPGTDMTTRTDKMATTKGHPTDKDLNPPTIEGMTTETNTNKAGMTAETGIILSQEIETGHILEAETVMTPLTDQDSQPQVQDLDNAMNAKAQTT